MADRPHHFVTARCMLCGDLTTFDPQRVPTLHGRPMCLDCTIEANAEREAQGLDGRWDIDESIWQPVEGLPE